MQSELAIVDDLDIGSDRSGVAAHRSGVTAVEHFDTKPSIGRDAYRLAIQEATVGSGTVVIGLLWLALYMVAVVFTLTSAHRESASIPKITPASVTAP